VAALLVQLYEEQTGGQEGFQYLRLVRQVTPGVCDHEKALDVVLRSLVLLEAFGDFNQSLSKSCIVQIHFDFDFN
jgi:hypothetical protein